MKGMIMARVFKTGGVSQCFHCGRQLPRIKGGFIYALIQDRDGHQIRTHIACQKDAATDGYIIVKNERNEDARS
jgi:hypothetical protein